MNESRSRCCFVKWSFSHYKILTKSFERYKFLKSATCVWRCRAWCESLSFSMFYFFTFQLLKKIQTHCNFSTYWCFFFPRELFVAKDVATWGDGELCTSTKPERPGANSRVCWCNGWKWQKSCFKLVHFSLARFICLSSFWGELHGYDYITFINVVQCHWFWCLFRPQQHATWAECLRLLPL